MYIDFDYYSSNGGTITDETTFNKLNRQAQIKLDYDTFNRINEFTSVPEEIKLCMIDLIDTLDSFETQAIDFGGRVPSSISNNGVSASFGGSSNSSNSSYDIIGNELSATISETLAYVKDIRGQNILYRGL